MISQRRSFPLPLKINVILNVSCRTSTSELLSGGEIESDKLVESGTEKEEKEEHDREEEGAEQELIKKSHVVVKRRQKKGRSNRHQQVRNRNKYDHG